MSDRATTIADWMQTCDQIHLAVRAIHDKAGLANVLVGRARVHHDMREMGRPGVHLIYLSDVKIQTAFDALRGITKHFDLLNSLAHLAEERAPQLNRFDCTTCGPGIGVDEDGCCRTCGDDATVILGGKVAFPEAAEERAPVPQEPRCPSIGPPPMRFPCGLPAGHDGDHTALSPTAWVTSYPTLSHRCEGDRDDWQSATLPVSPDPSGSKEG